MIWTFIPWTAAPAEVVLIIVELGLNASTDVVVTCQLSVAAIKDFTA